MTARILVVDDMPANVKLLEARLVDPAWRETAARLLRLPQAA